MAGKAADLGHDQYSVLDMIGRLVTTQSVTQTDAEQSSQSKLAVNVPTLKWQSNTQVSKAQAKASDTTMTSTHINHDSINDRQPPKCLSPDLCWLSRHVEKIDSADGKTIANMHTHINKLFVNQELPQPRFDSPCRHPGQLHAAVYNLE